MRPHRRNMQGQRPGSWARVSLWLPAIFLRPHFKVTNSNSFFMPQDLIPLFSFTKAGQTRSSGSILPEEVGPKLFFSFPARRGHAPHLSLRAGQTARRKLPATWQSSNVFCWLSTKCPEASSWACAPRQEIPLPPCTSARTGLGPCPS